MGATFGGCAFCKDKTPVLDINDKVNFLRAVKIFKPLSEADLKQLADSLQLVSFGKGTVIYHQDDYGDALFVIASGTVAVHVEGKEIDYDLNAGDHFGENALLRGCPRTVTVSAKTPLQALKVTRQKFQEMDLHHKLDFKKRHAMAGHDADHKVVTQPPSKKTEDDVATIKKAIKSNKNLSDIIELEDEQIQQFCDVAWERAVAEGESVIEQGSKEADYFYIVKEGSFEIDIEIPDDEEVGSDDHAVHSHIQQVGTKAQGDSFGELALLTNTPRAATVKALEPSILWVIDRITFKRSCARKADYYAKKNAKYLKSSEQFARLQDEDLMTVAKALLETRFVKDEHIFEQGEEGTSFYILYEGEVSAIQDGKELVRLTATPEHVEIFGEPALLHGNPYFTTMRVVSDVAKALSLDQESFEMLLGPIEAVLKGGKKNRKSGGKEDTRRIHAEEKLLATFKKYDRDKSGFIELKELDDMLKDMGGTLSKEEVEEDMQVLDVDKDGKCSFEEFKRFYSAEDNMLESPTAGKSAYAAAVKAAKLVRKSVHMNIRFEDLRTVGLLGCGGFGVVDLVEHKKTQQTYALKSLSKGYIVEHSQQEKVMMEKKVQAKCDSLFIIQIHETYNSDQFLYLLLELGLGGELYHTYQTRRFWASEPHAKFYTAGVVFAFKHMHRKKIIYRDLKPENILFNDKGHSKITDMGLATICVGKTYTTCGTTPYMAPEVVVASGHNHAVDWWTLGILTFELMAGHPPFEATNQAQVFAKIQRGIVQVKFPNDVAPTCRSYIRSMCQGEPAERLAMKKGGADNIKRNSWYADFDWAALENHTMTPPYVPQVAASTDLANFACKDEEKPPQIEYVDDGSGWDKDFASVEILL